jgi:hypothetical protein
MREIALAAALIFAFACWSAHAATWIVDPDGGGDATTIAGGLERASSGDMVLVRPGHYVENLTMVSGVTLRSSAGPDYTTIEAADESFPIISCVGLGDPVSIERFTLTAGRALDGAAIYASGSTVEIRDNVFLDNFAGDNGGGIAYIGGEPGIIEDNEFYHNEAVQRGGGVYCLSASPPILRNRFLTCSSRYGGAICCIDSASPDIMHNSVHLCHSWKWAGAVACMIRSSPLIERNWFDSNSAQGTAGAVICWNMCESVIRWNVFINNYCVNHAGRFR